MKIILLDSNSLINRAFYALPPMITKEGIFTNAVYGYLSMLSKLISEQKPTHIGATFDLKAPTFRHKMYTGYKASRKPMPEELASQLPILKDILRCMGIKILELEGYEADDIIGTIAKRFDYDTVIVSGDRDVLQLIDNNTVVFNTKRGVTDIKMYDLKALAEEGLTPEGVIEYKALAGDSSDCIPGVSGVGEKTAKELLSTYGTLDNIYKNAENIKGKLGERLIADRDKAYLSRLLAEINTNSPVPCTLDDLRFNDEMPQAFFDKLWRLEFKSLVDRFKKKTNEAVTEEAASEKAERIELESIDGLSRILSEVKGQIALNIDETIEFSTDTERYYNINVKHSLIDPGVNYDDAVAAFKNVLESGAQKVIFDVKSLKRKLDGYGIRVNEPYEDIYLKNYLIDSTRNVRNTEELLGLYNLENTPASILKLNEKLDKELEKEGLNRLYYDIELPLIEVLYDMEVCGFKLDTEVMSELSAKFNEEIEKEANEIYKLAGGVFNINSSKQLGKILYDDLKLAHGKKIKTGYSVAADTLEELDHPIIAHILQHRKISKLQSTYINGMLSVMDKNTKKVHTVFKQCLTSTGRLSSTEPNLQNIPVRTEEGREIRRVFIPENENNVLVAADYSQIELRLLAHFSGDPVLTDAYLNDRDIHTLTASKIFGVSEAMVDKSMRRAAKAVNFGIIYGISAFGLSNNIGITPQKAKIFQEKFFDTYPKIRDYMRYNAEFAATNGYIKTLEGRVRYFPEFKSSNHNLRSFAERAAMNMPLQGSASDIVKLAMLGVYRRLKNEGLKAKLILQIHDELLVDAPKSEEEAVKRILKEEMEGVAKLKIPLIVDVKAGDNWLI